MTLRLTTQGHGERSRTMRGFTLIELLLIIAILAILSGISLGAYLALANRNDIDIEARELESILNLARNRTLASEGKQGFGVYIDSSNEEYFLFPGDSYVDSSSENEKFELPPKIVVASMELRGGGEEIVFSRLSGATQQYGFIALQDVRDASRFRTICVEETGSIEIRDICEITSISYTDGSIDSDLASFPGWSGDPAQSFTTGSDSIYARGAELYLRRSSLDPSSTFNFYLEIREGSTAGAVIGKSWMLSSVSLSPEFDWIYFVFPRPVFLAGNTQYFLRLRSLPDSTFYDPMNPAYSAQGLIYWGYEHSVSSPPAYVGGDAWRYVGLNNDPVYQGQRLGPSDQYDFSFRVLYGIDPPPNRDSRHLEIELEDGASRGWSIRGASTLRLVFHDPPNADVIEDIPIGDYLNSEGILFDWEGSVDVNGDEEVLHIHSYYIDANDTTLSLHRERDMNQKAVDILIDNKGVISYSADGSPSLGAWGGNLIYR